MSLSTVFMVARTAWTKGWGSRDGVGWGVKDQYGIISHECERYAGDWLVSRDGVTVLTVITVITVGHSPTHTICNLSFHLPLVFSYGNTLFALR